MNMILWPKIIFAKIFIIHLHYPIFSCMKEIEFGF